MSEAALPLDDRGLAYGDGVFETVLVRDGCPVLWEEHLARLARGCSQLGFPPPCRDELDALPGKAPAGLSVLKLIVTRGSGGRGYLAPTDPAPRLLVQHLPFAPAETRWHEGVRVRFCALRLGIQPLLAGLKHLNRLENVLARKEWSDAAVAEGLLCDSDDHLIEATCMNLFWQRNGRLETPKLDRCGVAGTLRQALLAEHSVSEVEVGPSRLQEAEALWLGNSLQGLWPVTRLDDSDGRALITWTIGERHRRLQNDAQRLLGYPLLP
ncbi:aminodeoxychorismate lyase [Onishia niordana]|uniref:aminodeoxychorismate lyase n=1 Tax=Onishia niordana TaxID=2508711 RepID=UPI0010A027F7|nr:aminodeoxychorismate lyase [Halomonas niordiana]